MTVVFETRLFVFVQIGDAIAVIHKGADYVPVRPWNRARDRFVEQAQAYAESHTS